MLIDTLDKHVNAVLGRSLAQFIGPGGLMVYPLSTSIALIAGLGD